MIKYQMFVISAPLLIINMFSVRSLGLVPELKTHEDQVDRYCKRNETDVPVPIVVSQFWFVLVFLEVVTHQRIIEPL